MELFKFDPFGGLAVVGAAHDLLLQRLCYCYHTLDPQDAREGYGMSEVAALLEYSRPIPKGRVRWWRIVRSGRSTYICVDPSSPGYRETPPPEADALIEDIPLEMGLSILPAIAKTVLAARGKHRAPDQPDTKSILAGVLCASTKHVARDVPGFVALMERYSSGIQHGQYRTPDAMQEAISEVYRVGLFEVAVDCSHFSASIALFELQAEMNGWIQQRAYLKPKDFLRSYLEDRLASETVVASVGMHHLSTGQKTLQAALKIGCFWTFQQQVYLAVHHFWVAHSIAKYSKTPLPYSRTVAEESLVCAHAGLSCGLGLFFGRSWMDLARELSSAISRRDERPIEKFLHRYCSSFFPVIPRPLAQMIIAFAEILARPPGRGQEADLDPIFAADRAAGNSHPTSALYQSFARDYLLLNAAKHLGLESLAGRYAISISGRLIVDRAVS